MIGRESSGPLSSGLVKLRLLDLLYPRACSEGDAPIAEEGRLAICGRCEERLEWIRPPVCPRCGAGLAGRECGECAGKEIVFAGATALGRYDGAFRQAVLRFKFRGARHLADELGGRLAARIGRKVDVVTPVPMSPLKVLFRGYNAAELLADRVASHLGVPCRALLRKVRRTKPQADLALEERLINPRGAYRSKPARGVVLLVDDVLTTGATANACTEALRAAGATEVHVAVAAR
jgi:predicted amidophosphoribosyltransferase